MSLQARALQGKMKNIKVVEDFESGPHKAVTFQVEQDKEIHSVREFQVPPPPHSTDIKPSCQMSLRSSPSHTTPHRSTLGTTNHNPQPKRF